MSKYNFIFKLKIRGSQKKPITKASNVWKILQGQVRHSPQGRHLRIKPRMSYEVVKDWIRGSAESGRHC
jgi:hypothetical protein